MLLHRVKKPEKSPYAWQRKFAIFPVRVSESELVWLESYERRFIVDDPGNWAGGFRYHFEYRARGKTWVGHEKESF